MSTFVGLSNRIYLAQLDLSGLANEVNFGPLNCEMKPCTTFNDGGYSCVKPGLISGRADIKGFQDWAVDVLDDDISIGQLGQQYAFTVNPTQTTPAAGDTCWMARGVVDKLTPFSGAVGDMAAFELGLPYDFAIVQAKIGMPLTAITANTNGTAVALTGPTATQKLYGALHVIAYSGFTSVAVKIQSDDNSGMTSPTDRLTFNSVTARGNQFASVAGAFNTETYHRVVVTVTGTGSISLVVAFGVI